MSKTKFIIKHYETGNTHNKSFTKIQAAFETKNKLNNKTGLEWHVYAQTPFGETLVFENEIRNWQ